MNEIRLFKQSKGSPFPLGVSRQNSATNFAIISKHATSVFLCFFERNSKKLIVELPLSSEINKTGNVWHISINEELDDIIYAYRVIPNETNEFLLDPYVKSISSTHLWGEAFKSLGHHSYQAFGDIFLKDDFNWEGDKPLEIPQNELIIYEMHVRAFTNSLSSKVKNPGTFLGVIEKIPHLVDLGINAVELLPIQEFDELEYLRMHPEKNHHENKLYNFWGYSTVNFFSLMNRYASSSNVGAAVTEFKQLVKEFHKHKIEIILDVVFNHTAEGGKTGSVISFKGLDKAVYYMLDNEGDYLNYSGCGNTFNANDPIAIELIIAALRYYVIEMHVDGFRFDLASALTRNEKGEPLNPAPLIEAISKDPVLAKVKLIAEPWDASGLYQVGNFAPESKRWSEWNGKYRDIVRRFIKGTNWTSGEFAMRLCGSDDLYKNRGPATSINFITCHDGFSLKDLVSYDVKHNFSNGEENRDGTNDNYSWNCGIEGPTDNSKINALRDRQMKNFHLALMLSQGIPLLCMGDEYGHTKNGNNNTWCHDDELNWFSWDNLKQNPSFYRFYRGLIHFRKHFAMLRRKTFLNRDDIDWHGIRPFQPEWNSEIPFVAFTLKDIRNSVELYVAFNAQNHAETVYIPELSMNRRWKWVVNTNNPSPDDFYENGLGPIFHENSIKMSSFSAIVLRS